VILRSEWSVADDIRSGRLVTILPEYSSPSADVLAFIGPRQGRSARTSRFVDFLAAELTPVPWRS
jgi:DNA-binding transcriptional LysR family regulator